MYRVYVYHMHNGYQKVSQLAFSNASHYASITMLSQIKVHAFFKLLNPDPMYKMITLKKQTWRASIPRLQRHMFFETIQKSHGQ